MGEKEIKCGDSSSLKESDPQIWKEFIQEKILQTGDEDFECSFLYQLEAWELTKFATLPQLEELWDHYLAEERSGEFDQPDVLRLAQEKKVLLDVSGFVDKEKLWDSFKGAALQQGFLLNWVELVFEEYDRCVDFSQCLHVVRVRSVPPV